MSPAILLAVMGGTGVVGVITAALAWRRFPREERSAMITDASNVVAMMKTVGESSSRQITQLEERNAVLARRIGEYEGRVDELEGRVRAADSERAVDARKWEAERRVLEDQLNRLRREKFDLEMELAKLRRGSGG